MEEVKINIANDYNKKLGGRFNSLGPFSGEDFYMKLLEPKFILAKEKKLKLIIELDGTTGYGSSFLDQTFGELARKYTVDEVKRIIEFKTRFFHFNVKYIENEIWGKIK